MCDVIIYPPKYVDIHLLVSFFTLWWSITHFDSQLTELAELPWEQLLFRVDRTGGSAQHL